VLGRYRFDQQVVPTRTPRNLDVRFRTVHGAKGLEADFIVLPRMGAGTYGFPSNVASDPVLDLAMPRPESFPYAEERRLLYVALTRARRGVVLITPTKTMSPFVVELLADPNVVVAGDESGPAAPVEVCESCGAGTMVHRTGRYGAFLGCSTFPQCRNTRRPSG
jgi:DNA helicase-4